MASSASGSPGSPDSDSNGRLRGPLGLVLLGLVLYRVVYHLGYVSESPFAAATVSDGSVYELAALDLAAHPPLGSKPFYLQGAYAYFLALPIAYGRLPAALAAQLMMAVATWVILWRALGRIVDGPTSLATIILGLSYGGWAFYENKFLSAELTLFASVVVVAAWIRFERTATLFGAGLLGFATAVAALARPNLVLVLIPLGFACAAVARVRDVAWAPRLATLVFGCAVGLAPMVIRNAVVTGQATFMPAHGGGTSFYIGNNAHANGVWNGGALLSGDVTHELDDVAAARLSDESPEQAVGRELYARAWRDIVGDPVRWFRLELRKLWLVIGNDELAQDYDMAGERELIPWAWPISLPFGVLLGLAVPGAVVLRRTAPALWIGRAWALGGLILATFAANLVFFTSAQHRLPLVIPVLVLSAPIIGLFVAAVAARSWAPLANLRGPLIVGALIALQALWPRTRRPAPPAAHYFNLALAYERVAEFGPAMAALDRAVERAPEHAVIRMERAVMRRRLGANEAARADLRVLARQSDVPIWIRERAAAEAVTLGLSLGSPGLPP